MAKKALEAAPRLNMEIEGKIAEILNTRELVINRGSDHGVVPDMVFAVMEPHLSIVDPDTEEPLGDLKREKIRVRVSETYPRFSLARTYQTYRELNRDRGAMLGGLSPQSYYVTEVKRLNTDGASDYQEGEANVAVSVISFLKYHWHQSPTDISKEEK